MKPLDIDFYRYHNNVISYRLSVENKKVFTMGNIDGVTYCYYSKENELAINKRLIIYDSKHELEPIKQSQLALYYEFVINMDWSKYDSESGVYFIIHNENATIYKFYKIVKQSPKCITIQNDYSLKYYKTLSKDEFHHLAAAADMRKIDYKIINPDISYLN